LFDGRGGDRGYTISLSVTSSVLVGVEPWISQLAAYTSMAVVVASGAVRGAKYLKPDLVQSLTGAGRLPCLLHRS
jgi:hypothetical protein